MQGLEMKRFEWKQILLSARINQNFDNFLVAPDNLRLESKFLQPVCPFVYRFSRYSSLKVTTILLNYFEQRYKKFAKYRILALIYFAAKKLSG